MDRRHFLAGLGVGVFGLTGSGVGASGSFNLSHITGDASRLSGAGSSVRPCKIIGIGGAGRNFVMAAHSGGLLAGSEWTPEFICIDLDGENLKQIDAANPATPTRLPIKAIPLGTCGSGGWINGARVTALRNRDTLKHVLADTKAVCLVAGCGGGTGSGVTPIMARLARESGARTLAAIITPFAFEDRRNRKADLALGHLRREADCVLTFSNEEWSLKYGDQAMLADVFSGMDRQIATSIGQWLDTIAS